MSLVLASRSDISSGACLASVSLFSTLADLAEPKEIARYWLPNKPSAAGGQSGNQRVSKSRKHSHTLAAVVQCVFFESLCQPIARGRAYCRDAEVGADSQTIPFGPLFPLWRRVVRLADAGRKSRASQRIGAERVEDIVAEFRLLRGTYVG
jgi:hypothetical protein